MGDRTTLPRVEIILATFNGARYLDEQLSSLRKQSFQDWRLLISDDGSSDATAMIIKRFKDSMAPGQVELFTGPQNGSAANFLSLLERCSESAFVALCDQDDIWDVDKLDTALKEISRHSGEKLVLYGCRLRIFGGGVPVGKQIKVDRYRHTISRAIVQNGISGNTMVLNPPAVRFAKEHLLVEGVRWHDWWLYTAFVTVGAVIIADRYVGIDYRKHADNVFGPKQGVKERLRRFFKLFTGEFLNEGLLNMRRLSSVPINNEKNSSFVSNFSDLPRNRFLYVIQYLRSGVRRQSFLETLALYVGLFFAKRSL